MPKQPQSQTCNIVARVLVLVVFASNLYCIVQFLAFPAGFTAAYQLEGVGASAAIQGMGVAFAMWNATYPVAALKPARYRIVLGIVIAQQLIGLVGELAIYAGLGAGAEVLGSSILRFVVFDAAGLVLLLIAFFITRKRRGSNELVSQ